MTVYVDDFRVQARVGRLSARWSHLTVGPFDDLAELHEFAARIGLQRRWFQAKPWPLAHYDVTDSKREQALEAGAVSLTWRQMGAQTSRAVAAWKAASGGYPRVRTPDGRPPEAAMTFWTGAAALYEAASADGAA